MKAIGVLVIALGLIVIVIGIQGTQGTILQTLKGINPVLRQKTGTGSETVQRQAASNQSGGGPIVGMA